MVRGISTDTRIQHYYVGPRQRPPDWAPAQALALLISHSVASCPVL